MIRILIILILINSYLFSFLNEDRYVNGKYNNNLKVIWMNNRSKGKLQSLFTKAQNVVYQKLYKDNEFNNIKNEQKKDYRSILAILDDPEIYTDKKKLFEADMLDFYNNDLNDQLVVVFKLEKAENSFRLYGLKLFKDGDNAIATTYEVNSYTKDITQKKLEDMIYFFIKSSINDYESRRRINAKQIVFFKDEKKNILEIETYKDQKIKRFTTDITSQDFSLAQKLHLIGYKNLNQSSASEYCHLLGMMLENKIFLDNGDENSYYYYEQLFEDIAFQDGRVVSKRVYDTNLKNRDFRCVDAKDSIAIMPIKEYEIQNIGVKYRLNNSAIVHEKRVVAVDILLSQNKKSLYSVIIDEGAKVSFWKDDTLLFTQDLKIENIQSIKLEDNFTKVVIKNRVEIKEFTISDKSLILEKTIPIVQASSGIFEVANTIFNSKKYSIDSYNYLLVDSTSNDLGYWPTHLAVSSDNVVISNSKALYKYTLDENFYVVNREQLSGFNGEVTKILYFNSGEYLIVGTSKSEIILYKKDGLKPIKVIANFGYSINDISISDNDRYIIVANGDEIVYIFELDVILNNIILNQEKK